VTHLEDTPKTTPNGVSDMLGFRVGGTAFLAVGSSQEGGLTTCRVGTDGSMTMTDVLTPKDGLWVEGLDNRAVINGFTPFRPATRTSLTSWPSTPIP